VKNYDLPLIANYPLPKNLLTQMFITVKINLVKLKNPSFTFKICLSENISFSSFYADKN